MSGARLAILYGYVPCQLGLCGPGDKKKRNIINRYLKGEERLESKIRSVLKEFKGAYPYYQLIARSNNVSDPLDYKVVEAYWIGNKLLKKVTVADYKRMIIRNFLPFGKITREKISKFPSRAIASHSFHVLFLGSVTGRAKLEGNLLDVCRVGWGRITEIINKKEKRLIVNYQPLIVGRKTILSKAIKKEIKWNKLILPEVVKGDWVSIHWNTGIQILKNREVANLRKITKNILKML